MILAAIGASTFRSNEVKISKISLEKWKFLCNIMAGVCCVGPVEASKNPVSLLVPLFRGTEDGETRKNWGRNRRILNSYQEGARKRQKYI